MKKNYLILMLAAAAATVTVSCNKLIPQPDPAKTIAIDPLITRATETDFQEGDKVGLTIKRGEDVFAQNRCFTYDGTQFTSDLKWYTEGEQSSTFTAYYPYAQTQPSVFEVSADQTSAGYQASDLMAARKEDVTPQNSVTMIFKHLLTRIVVSVDNQAGADIKSVSLKNSVLGADVDYDALSVAVKDQAPADILMNESQKNTRYIAIVVPQTVKFAVAIELNNGAVITKSLNETELKAGGQYTISAVVLPSDADVNISGDIENWTDEGSISEKEITFHEYDDYFEYDGVNYNTVVLPDGNKWMAENMCFLPDGKTVSGTPGDKAGVWYPYSVADGVCTPLTDKESIEAKGYLYDYNTIVGATITAENFALFEGCQGICPPGWHVPTRAEWFALCGNSNRSALLDEPTGTKTDPEACFYDSAFSAGTVVKFNEGGFNFPLTGTIANNAYNNLVIDASVCDVTELYGGLRMTYLACSSANSATQFFGLMTTFTSTNNKGKVSLSYATLEKAAVALRCVKNTNN